MLTTIAIILIVLWALGFLGGFVSSGLVHALLVIALVIIAVRLLSGRQAV